MLTRHQRPPAGFTLVELMLTLLISTLMLAALIAFFINAVRHNRANLEQTRLDQQMQSTLDMMTNDIRRAGYWANATTDLDTGANTNPFMASGTDLTINGNCILLTYDRNGDGVLAPINTAGDDERYAYRLLNGVIQTRPWDAAFDCSAPSSAWEDITDLAVVTVTGLSFTANNQTIDLDGSGPGTENVTVRNVGISLTGQLTKNSAAQKTLTRSVRVRNDRFMP